MNIWRYIMWRGVMSLPVAILVGVFAFFLMHMIPGSPAVVILGPGATTEQIEQLTERLGLNKPIYVQFKNWVSGLCKGDFGHSVFLDVPVLPLILHAIRVSLLLSGLSLLVAVLIGIPVGIIAAVKKDTVLDQASLTTAILGASIPSFWLGLNLILLFGVMLRVFPTSGYEPVLGKGGFVNLKYLIMPAIALGVPNSALIIRLTRSSMLDVISSDYINTARAKGLIEIKVILKHAFKNAGPPILTVVGFTLISMLSQAVVTENVFLIPGIGRVIVSSILRRDYTIIQGILIFVACICMVVNLLTDVAYAFLDPRIRY